jgi:DNA-binding transcriptional MerR regulator
MRKKNNNQLSGKGISDIDGSGKKAFTIPEIERIANVSRRQVNYWEKIGLLKSTFQNLKSQDGKVSFYFSRVEVIKALIFCEMKNRGFTLHQIKMVARNLLAMNFDLEKSGSYILSDGYSVYLAETDKQVVDILRHARQMILIPIEDQLEKLKKAA